MYYMYIIMLYITILWWLPADFRCVNELRAHFSQKQHMCKMK